MRKSTLFFIFCVAFILGVAVHSIIAPEKILLQPIWWYAGFLIGATGGLVLCLGSNPSQPALPAGRPPLTLRGGVVGLGFAFLLLGLFRYSQTIPKIDERHLVYYLGQRVNLSGVVDELPRGREKTIAYVIRLQSHEGKLLLTADALPSFEYGDRLSFSCVPEELSEFEQYARREGVQASCAFPEYLTRLDGAGGSRLRGTLFAVRRAFDERLERLFPDPYGGLLAGILYGDTSGLSAALQDAFRKTGIAHITALSGYNITIISFVLLKIGRAHV